MKTILYLILLSSSMTTFGQSGIDVSLKRQLDSMMVRDQDYRIKLSGLISEEKVDSAAKVYHIEPNLDIPEPSTT